MSNIYNNSFGLINIMSGEAAGHYYNDSTRAVSDYADGWYIRKAKQDQFDVREMLIDWKLRRNRLEGLCQTETGLHRPLETSFHTPEIARVPHLEYKHKKGKHEHLYKKHR